ncbi:LGFP repeat family protein [Mycobacterium kansasii]|uniref:LGFP repeat family protein n=1 Tax=Mycobacterium kansasii TaxID=1768 RepID=A0A1V3XV28_MYCKA|nr:LGFP repeat family protein [Mycobacterium kansasii]
MALDPTAAINMAWRAAGGAAGPLGAKKGAPYPIGGDGIAQDFVGGKIFFSPATGANAVEGAILAKYESLGGPVSSDLGFPIANESDGGITPASRIAAFSAADKPVIFWTPDHGAFVVRGAMKAAWDKLKGATGKLGRRSPTRPLTATWCRRSSPAARCPGTVRATPSRPTRRTWRRCCPGCRCPGRISPVRRRLHRTARSSPGTGGGWWPWCPSSCSS